MLIDPFARRLLLAIYFLASISMPANAIDPSRRISQYAHTAWRLQDGAFGGTPNAITQTTDGYLWIGTESGLVRFDGVRFLPWPPPKDTVLPSSSIESLLGASDGSLWIGTTHGLARWTAGGVMVNYPAIRGRINSIKEDPTGTIWVVRSRNPEGPLCGITAGETRCYGIADGLNCAHGVVLDRDKKGNLWIGSSEALCRWKLGSSTTYLEKELKQAKNLAGVSSLAVDENGSLWVGFARRGSAFGLKQLSNEHWKNYVAPGIDGRALPIYALFFDRTRALWVGTINQGIYRIYDGRVDHFGSADGLSSESVNGFYQDMEGNLWVATSKGIDCFRDFRFASFSDREGLSADAVAAVLAGRSGEIWIGNQGRLDVIRQGTVSRITTRNNMPGQDVTSLLEDHAGALWLGIDNGLAVYEQTRFRLITRPDGSPVGVVVGIAEDTDHNIWVETIQGPAPLLRIYDYRVRDEIPMSRIPRATVLAADPEGGIWLLLRDDHLARYRNGRLETFSLNHNEKSSPAKDLLVEGSSIWVSTTNGLVRWKDGKTRILNSKNGLPCDAVNTMVRDNQRILWLSTTCGFVSIPDSELEKWWAQPNGSVNSRTFDMFDGAQPGPASFQPAASKSLDGKLWFANDNVLQMIDPSHLELNTVPPPVHIEQIVADGKTYPITENLRLPALTRDLEIDYTALSFSFPQKVFFRYRLEGRDAEWQNPQTRRQAFYSDLRPGKYQFHVIACNNEGVWNQSGATFQFHVLPAFYQTTAFLISSLIAAGTLLWATYRARVRYLSIRIRERADERAGERVRIARDLHDTLLQSFQGLMFRLQAVRNSLPDRPTDAIQALDTALDRGDQAISEARDAVQGLRSSAISNNDLSQGITVIAEELVAANRDRSSATFNLLVEGQRRDLDPILLNEIYRIAREALANAFHHAHAQKIEAEITYGDGAFRLRIRDDGSGIDPSVRDRGGRAGHWGLTGMRERAQTLGGQLEVWSKEGAGTEVDFTIPNSIAYSARKKRENREQEA